MISDDILCQNFKAYMLLERGYSENTRIAYLSDLVRLHQWLAEGGYTLTMATPEVLADFVFQIHDIGVSHLTQALIVAGVKAFYHYLKLEHLISEDPSMLLERPAIGRSLPEVLSVEEIDAMCATFDVADPLGVRNRAILETLYGSGLRVSELCMLEERLVNLADRFLIVSGKGNKERMVPMSDTAVRWIEEYIAVRDSSYSAVKPGNEAYLFFNRRGAHLSRVMVFYIVRDAAEAAGVTKTISPHTMRHSFATHMLEGGANLRAIQQMLGHTSIGTTEMYLHMDTTRLRSEILNCHPRNRGRG